MQEASRRNAELAHYHITERDHHQRFKYEPSTRADTWHPQDDYALPTGKVAAYVDRIVNWTENVGTPDSTRARNAI